jgi:hypothetical protein
MPTPFGQRLGILLLMHGMPFVAGLENFSSGIFIIYAIPVE